MTRSVHRPFHAMAVMVLSAAALTLSGCDRLFGGPPGVEETREIAKELYIYGYPMVVAYQSLYEQNVDTSSPDYRGPIGTISTRARNFEPADSLVRPNSDVVVSTLQVDLRSEPMILCMPGGLGPVGSVVLGGIGTLLVALAWIRAFPALARRDRLHREN